jgi:hypothetical protein
VYLHGNTQAFEGLLGEKMNLSPSLTNGITSPVARFLPAVIAMWGQYTVLYPVGVRTRKDEIV